MALTPEQQTLIVKTVVGVFDAAPGATYLNLLAPFGSNQTALVNALVNTDGFKAIYPDFYSHEQFANKFLDALVGSTVNATDKANVAAYAKALLEGGASRANVVLALINALDNVAYTDATWGAAAKAFDNQVTVAKYYTIDQLGSSTSISTLQSVIAGVTNTTDVSTPAAIEAAIGSSGAVSGQTFALTADQDTLTGTSGNDTFNAGVVQTANAGLKDSLQNVDSINGGAGTDTLNVTLNDGDVKTPSLTSVENVVLRLTATGSGIDLSASTGVTNLTVANSTVDQTAANIVAGVASLTVKNQNKAVNFDKSTATTLALNLDTVGASQKAADQVVVDLGKVTAGGSKATTLNITANNANVEVKDTQGGSVATTLSIAATGANTLKLSDGATTATALTVTGAGSVDLTGAALTKVKTITVADGGVKLDATGNTATTLTATTGAGADTLTLTGANLTSASTGAGNDKLTITSALAATSTVDLGAGDDILTLNAAPAAGVSLNGGDGTDTIKFVGGDYQTITVGGGAWSAANLAKITNFETLGISDALANTKTYDVSKISGVTSFVAGNGVAAGGTANVTNLGANANVELAGAIVNAVTEVFTVQYGADAAGSTTLIFDGVTTTLGAGAKTAAQVAAAVLAAGNTTNWNVAAGTSSDTLVFTRKTAGNVADVTDVKGAGTSTASTSFNVTTQGVTAVGDGTAVLSYKTDTSADVLNLKLNANYTETNDATSTITAITHTVSASLIETLNVNSTGTANTPFLAATGTKADGVNNTLNLTDADLVTLNVTGDQAFTFTSGNLTKLATIDASALTAGATINASGVTTATQALSIKGSATAANTLTGGSGADTIIGGSGNDVITGGAKGDTLTGNGGNDKFVFVAGDSVIGTGSFDTISDFVANTLGNGANGAADITGAITAGLTDATKLNGDILSIAKTGTGAGGIVVDVLGSAADATTFLANHKAANTVVAALDSSTGNLYIDNAGADGVADLFIHLTGVTTINAAAFQLV